MDYNQLVVATQNFTENQFPDTYLANGTTVSPTQQINRLIQQAEQKIYNSVQIPPLRKNVLGTATQNNPYLSCPDDYLSSYSLAVIDPATGSYEYLLNKDVNFIRAAYPPPGSTGIPKYYSLFGPRYTARNELSFLLGPTPNANYQLELHYYCYPLSIIQNVVSSLGAIINPGSGYTDGSYTNIPAIGGVGDGVLLNITVSGGIVTSVSIAYGGSGYNVGNVLNATIGTSGSGFAVPIATVDNPTGTSWLGDNFDSVLLNGVLAEAATYMKQEPDMVALYNQKFQESLMQLKRLGDGLEQGDSYRNGNPRVKVT
jgi:hypothetical protein